MSKILVTGGNGFVAAQVLIQGLNKGYTIVTTVRTQEKAEQTKKAISRHVGDKISNLSFAIVPKIDTDDAFNEVLKANEFTAVLHTATPFRLDAENPRDITDPAIGSTKSILDSINKLAPTVKRVILTSSFATIVDRSKGWRPGHVYTEKEWNPTTWEETLQGPVNAYYGAKKFAEQAAWDYVAENKPGYELVSLNPPMVFGQVAQFVESTAQLNTSSLALYNILHSKQGDIPAHDVPLWVNVADIGLAHILAIESPKAANQRILICADLPFSNKQIADIFRKEYPDLAPGVATKLGPGLDATSGLPEEGFYKGNNALSKEILGIQYQNLHDTMVAFVESIKDLPTSSK